MAVRMRLQRARVRVHRTLGMKWPGQQPPARRVPVRKLRCVAGQPPITAILGARASRDGHELDKTTLLTALLAFTKGDFSVRLPVDLEEFYR